MIKTQILNFDDEHFVACNQGSQFDVTLTWTDSAGLPVDLSQHTAIMQVRRTFKDDVVVELSTENGKIIMDADGNIRFLINFMETAMMPFGRFTYDFKLYNPDGIPDTPFRGNFVITGAITV